MYHTNTFPLLIFFVFLTANYNKNGCVVLDMISTYLYDQYLTQILLNVNSEALLIVIQTLFF